MAMENPNHHTPVGGIVLVIALNAITWVLSCIEHFISHPVQSLDVLAGFLVKALAAVASFYTIKLVRKKLKNKT